MIRTQPISLLKLFLLYCYSRYVVAIAKRIQHQQPLPSSQSHLKEKVLQKPKKPFWTKHKFWLSGSLQLLAHKLLLRGHGAPQFQKMWSKPWPHYNSSWVKSWRGPDNQIFLTLLPGCYSTSKSPGLIGLRHNHWAAKQQTSWIIAPWWFSVSPWWICITFFWPRGSLKTHRAI